MNPKPKLTPEARQLAVDGLREFVSLRDPSITAVEWYRPTGPQAENRDEIYNRLVRSLPRHVVNDIEHFVKTALESKLDDRKKDLDAREARIKTNEHDDHKRENELHKREQALQGKEVALKLGEAQLALYAAQSEAELSIMRKYGPYGHFFPFPHRM